VVVAPPDQLKQRVTTGSQPNDSVSHRQVLERLKVVLEEIDGWSMPVGEVGTAFLDCLELMDQIREKARQRAKQMLLKEPGVIPDWTASQGSPVRELDNDAWKVFVALQSALATPLTSEEFIGACRITLQAARQLLSDLDPSLSPEAVEVQLSRTLADLLHYRKGSVRLTRVKELPPPKPAREITSK